MPEQESLLRHLVVAKQWRTHSTFLREFKKAARALACDPDHGPAVANLNVGRSTFERWLTADESFTGPHPSARAVLERLFGYPAERLFAPVPADFQSTPTPVPNGLLLLEKEIAMSANSASEQAGNAAARVVDEASLEQLYDDLLEAARAYATVSPLASYVELNRIHNQTLGLLDRTGRPEQEKALYLNAARVQGLLSVVAFDLGQIGPSAKFARNVQLYNAMVGDPGIASWALGKRALLAYWGSRPAESLRLLDQALAIAPPGIPTARLLAIQARAYSHLGDAQSTLTAAAAAHEAEAVDSGRADELMQEIGGEFSFDQARLSRCLGTAHIMVGQSAEAIAEAGHALELYAARGPLNSMPRVIAEARIDLAHGYLLTGDLDAAAESLRTVLDLQVEERIEGLLQRLRGVRAALVLPSFHGSVLARDMGDRIESFTAETVGALALPIAGA